MKKIIALAGAFALAACGGADTEAEPAADTAAATGPVLPASSAGTYVGVDTDGAEVITTLNADGTFADTKGEEILRAGTWEDNIRGTCFTETDVEGEQCYTMGTVGEDGTVEVTGPDGVTTIMTKAS